MVHYTVGLLIEFKISSFRVLGNFEFSSFRILENFEFSSFRVFGKFRVFEFLSFEKISFRNILSNDNSLVENVKTMCKFSNSDHNMLSFSVNIEDRPIPNEVTPQWTKGDYSQINFYLAHQDFSFVYDMSLSLQAVYDRFISILKSAINTFIPHSSPRDRLFSPAHIVRSFNSKNKAWESFINGTGSFSVYSVCSKRHTLNCKRFAMNSEQKVIDSRDPKRFYGYVNSRIKDSSKSTIPRINSMENPAKVLTSPSDVSNCLSQFFHSVYSEGAIIDTPPDFFPPKLPNFPEIDINSSHVISAIKQLSDKQSLTPEGIPSYFIKRVSDTLLPHLTFFYQRSLISGSVPKQWNEAIVIPLLKKPPRIDPKNYRPISLTSSFCKICEIFLSKRLLNFFTSNSLLDQNQFGFLPGRSTLSNLMSCISSWQNSLQNNKPVDCIYVDFQKAFDSVSHQLLLYKLQKYGVSDVLCKWIASYLSNRSFKVRVNDCLSLPKPCTSGVPQGSVIGPLLFLIYVNDISWRLASPCFLFADDLKIFRELNCDFDSNILESDLECISIWATKWLMNINESKSQHLSVNSSSHPSQYTLNKVVIPNNNSVRDLGVTVCNDLSFRSHISEIVKKANRVANCILRAFQLRKISSYRKAFITYVRPILEYASPVWSPNTVMDTTSVENVQRRFTRIAFRKCVSNPLTLSYAGRLVSFQLKSLAYRRLVFDLSLCYRIIHGFEKNPSLQLFTISRSKRPHSFQISRNFASKRQVFGSFANRMPAIWNLLPSHVVEAGTLSAFHARLEKVDLSTIVPSLKLD